MAEPSSATRPRRGLGYALVLFMGIAIGLLLANMGKQDEPDQPPSRLQDKELVQSTELPPVSPRPTEQVADVQNLPDRVKMQIRVYEVAQESLGALGIDPDQLAAGPISLQQSAQSVSEQIALLREQKKAKVLAEPTLTTIPGRRASFQVGGEFPIHVPQNGGTTSIEFKEYGTSVSLLPTLLSDGRYRISLTSEISEISPAHTVTVGEHSIPGLRVRSVDTELEMSDGESVVFGGLVQNDRRTLCVATLEKVAARGVQK